MQVSKRLVVRKEIPMDNSLIGTDDDIQLKKAIEILEK